MTALYAFCAAAGVPLLAFFAFAGDADADAGGFDGGLDAGGLDAGGLDAGGLDGGFDADADIGAGEGSVATTLASVISIASLAFFLAFFGSVGLIAGWTGASAVTTFVLALALGLAGAGIYSVAFGWLRRNSNSSELSTRDITGRVGRIAVPIRADSRGRITVQFGDERIQLSAVMADLADQNDPVPAPLDVGDPVLVLDVENGVARVSPVDPELA